MASLSALSSGVALQARFGSKVSRRVTARRGVRASALPQKGRPALTMVARVPSEKESEVDALFASHERFMHDTHVIGEAEADDIGHPRMLEYYVAKSAELSDPLDAGTSPAKPLRAGSNNAAFFFACRVGRLTCRRFSSPEISRAASGRGRGARSVADDEATSFFFRFLRMTRLTLATRLHPTAPLDRCSKPPPPPATCCTP